MGRAHSFTSAAIKGSATQREASWLPVTVSGAADLRVCYAAERESVFLRSCPSSLPSLSPCLSIRERVRESLRLCTIEVEEEKKKKKDERRESVEDLPYTHSLSLYSQIEQKRDSRINTDNERESIMDT